MVAGPEVGDHFMVKSYNELISHLNSKILFFLKKFFFTDIFLVIYMYLQKKIRISFLVFDEIRLVKG